MYCLAAVIENENRESLIPEVSFNPSGSMFAVSFTENNEVRIFDSHTRSVLRVYKNPDARFDHPHGVLMTDKHIIISNGHGFTRPCTLNIYRIDDPSDKPASVYETPFEKLREGHSLAINGSRLVISYCENKNKHRIKAKTGAIVSYRFDDESGVISEPIGIRESCFNKYGDTKGVSFNGDGTKIYVSFNSTVKPITKFDDFLLAFKRAINLLKKKGARELAVEMLSNASGWPSLKNGIAVFNINDDGELSKEPFEVLLRKEFCRLENINIVGDKVVITDTINNAVYLHDLNNDPQLENPVQTITEYSTLPHGAKFSPDMNILVVTNYGLNVMNNKIQWGSFTSPRGDNIFVYELQVL